MVNDGKPQSGSISMYLLQCLIEQGLSSSAHTAGMHDSSWLYKPLMNNTILGLLGNSSDEVSIEIIGDHPQSHVGIFLHPSKPRAGFGSSGGMFQCAEGRWVSQQDFHWIDLREHLQDSPWLLQVFTCFYHQILGVPATFPSNQSNDTWHEIILLWSVSLYHPGQV